MRDNRFKIVPIVTTVLEVVAVLLVIFALYQLIAGIHVEAVNWRGGIGQYGQEVPPVSGFWARFQSLLGPSSASCKASSSRHWPGGWRLFAMTRVLVLRGQPTVTGTRERLAAGGSGHYGDQG